MGVMYANISQPVQKYHKQINMAIILSIISVHLSKSAIKNNNKYTLYLQYGLKLIIFDSNFISHEHNFTYMMWLPTCLFSYVF
jgi:hypothetical protein